MTDPAPDAPEPEAEETPAETPDTGDLAKELDKWKAQARKHEERAKANALAAKELEQVKQQSMSEIERAVEQAKSDGRAEGLRVGSVKIAAAELKAAATGRLDADQLATLLENVDLARFLDEDGEVDGEKVAKFIDGIAPKPTEPTEPSFPAFAQGARGSVPLGGDALEQLLKRTVGTR
jgi:hypothetical protein